MFQICVHDQKVQKAQNTQYSIIEIWKSMEPNKCTYEKNYENIYLNVSYGFEKFGKSRKIKVWHS
jgi:uncharacterized protein YbbC (DUF1343 family)